MSELVEFIRGCLDADEEFARATSPRWWSEDELLCAYEALAEDSHRMADARFAARHDPARVLAEVNAKRAIVDMLADAEAVIARIGPDLDKPGDAAEWANYHAWRQAVEALAQPYAGEPGWRDEWGTQ